PAGPGLSRRARRWFPATRHSDRINPFRFIRCNAGYSEPWLTRNTSWLICSIRCASPQPCIGPSDSAFSTSISSVPWSSSCCRSAITPLLQAFWRRLPALLQIVKRRAAPIRPALPYPVLRQTLTRESTTARLCARARPHILRAQSSPQPHQEGTMVLLPAPPRLPLLQRARRDPFDEWFRALWRFPWGAEEPQTTDWGPAVE